MLLRIPYALSLASTVLAVAGAVAAPAVAEEKAGVEFFEKKIRPLLVDNCYTCHSASTNAKGGLRVDDRNGLIHGGGSGAAIVPGQPEKSLLLQAVKYQDGLEMPPKKQLSEDQIADLTKWIADGAVWPKEELAIEVGKHNAKYEKLRAEHWAWQPLKATAPPAVQNAGWVRDDLDRYVLARLEENKLAPVADADKLTLIRRVTFDLTGLPPTPEETAAFVADESSQAFEKVVDRLLASPAFGERWGRHWLDVARYGESTGSSRNVPYPHAWRYRDYVIDALNRDKPYDQFIREQVAGDLLSSESQTQRDEQLVATGFLALGVKDVNQRFKVRFVMDNIDEQIDTVTRSVLALTASCARCHDHKFDPIPTSDYYALAGIFHSTDLCAGVRNKMGGGGLDYYDKSLLLRLDQQAAVEDPAADKKLAEAQAAVDQAQKAFEAIRGKPEGKELAPNGKPKQQMARQKLNRAQAELNALTDPAAKGAVALGARDAKSVGDTEIRIRGEAEKLGPVVPRGFLSVVEVPDVKAINAAQSGRLELAEWLTSEQNPLTSRVLVNRVWQHLFGQGIVKSTDNFGVTGDTPSHPELLDHLAARFVRDGWSVKRLVRSVVLSHAYQLGAENSPANHAIDPANRFVWRHSPRRLQAEEIRDATLAISGQLSTSRPEASPAKKLRVVEMRNNGPEARGIDSEALASVHRSVYLPLIRGLTPRSLEVFDFAEQGMVTGSRDTTTVATQALYLLNDPFVRKQSLTLAERLLAQGQLDSAARVSLAYKLTLGREATANEIQRAQKYLAEYEVAARDVVKLAPAPAEAIAAAEPAEDPSSATNSTDAEAKKPAQPVNPDEADQSDTPVVEAKIEPATAEAAAWASFCQALIGSAEFRYLK